MKTITTNSGVGGKGWQTGVDTQGVIGFSKWPEIDGVVVTISAANNASVRVG